MTSRWAIILTSTMLGISVAMGAVAGYAGASLHRLLTNPSVLSRAVGTMGAGALIVFLGATLVRGLPFASRVVLPLFVALAIVSAGVAVVTGIGTGAGVLAFAGFFGPAVAALVLGSLARAAAGAVSGVMFFLVAIMGGITGGLLGGGLVSIAIALTAAWLGRRGLRETGTQSTLSRATIALASLEGTRFRGADLRNARFDGATLSYCDFRGARLDGAGVHMEEAPTCLFDRLDAPAEHTGSRSRSPRRASV